MTVCFSGRGIGYPVLELVAPPGPDSPVARKAKSVGGPYHICYEVADIGSAISELRALEMLSEPVPAVAFGGRKKNAWLMTNM